VGQTPRWLTFGYRLALSLFSQARLGSNEGLGSIDSGLWEGYHESRRCSRDTYPDISPSIIVYEDQPVSGLGVQPGDTGVPRS